MGRTEPFVVEAAEEGRGPWLVLAGGDLTGVPREIPHTFANLSDEPVHAFGVTVPAGLEGMFAEQAAYFGSLEGPPDEEIVRDIGSRYGVRVVGPPLTE